MRMAAGADSPRGMLAQYIAGMIRATPTLPDRRNQSRRRCQCGLALLLCLGLPMAQLAACSKPEPGVPAPAVSAPGSPSAQASYSRMAAAPAPTPAAGPAASKPAAALPPAVVAFQKQRDACDHFRGEEAYDKQRAAFLKAQLAKACKGSDKALAALRKRFAQNPEAISALRDYEDRIE